MGLSLLERLIAIAVLMAILATVAASLSIYLWVTEATDKDEVQRILYPVVPGFEPGEVPPAAYMAQEILQGIYRGIPNPQIKTLWYTIETGSATFPSLLGGHLIYTTPFNKRTCVDTKHVTFGQKPAMPFTPHYLVIERTMGSHLFTVGTGQGMLFMDPGDNLYVMGDPGLRLLAHVVECDITDATPRTHFYRANSPFTYTAPPGYQAHTFTGVDVFFQWVAQYSHNFTGPIGPSDTILLTRNGLPHHEQNLSVAPALNQPSGAVMGGTITLNPGDTCEFSWPAIYDQFMSVAFTVVEIAV